MVVKTLCTLSAWFTWYFQCWQLTDTPAWGCWWSKTPSCWGMCPSVPQLDYTADYKPRLLANLFFFVYSHSALSALAVVHTHICMHTQTYYLRMEREGRMRMHSMWLAAMTSSKKCFPHLMPPWILMTRVSKIRRTPWITIAFKWKVCYCGWIWTESFQTAFSSFALHVPVVFSTLIFIPSPFPCHLQLRPLLWSSQT